MCKECLEKTPYVAHDRNCQTDTCPCHGPSLCRSIEECMGMFADYVVIKLSYDCVYAAIFKILNVHLQAIMSYGKQYECTLVDT